MKDFATNAQVAIQTAFQTAFGFPVSDPQAANITSGQMQTFLNNVFSEDNTNTSALFNDTNWAAQWSNASSTQSHAPDLADGERQRLHHGERHSHAQARHGIFDDGLSGRRFVEHERAPDGHGHVSRHPVGGHDGRDHTAAAIGVSQTRVTTANSELNKTLDVVKSRINSLESVDPLKPRRSSIHLRTS